mgnify:CR=1 FL=1
MSAVRYPRRMFVWVLGLFLGLVGLLASLAWEGRPLDPRLVLAAVVAGLPVLGVLLRMATAGPDAVRDWLQGGVLDVREGADRVTWIDQALVFTRRGEVDKRRLTLRLERRLLCGLIPLGVVTRPLGDFYRVEVRSQAVEDHRRRREGLFGTGQVRISHWNHELSLVDRRAARLLVMDLSVTPRGQKKERVIVRLREALQALLEPPPARPVAPEPERDERPAGAGEDFESWRARRARG